MKSFVAVAAVVTATSFAVLLAPPVPDSKLESLCASNQSIGSHLHYVKSCDSALFLKLAANPALLLSEDGKVWQSRPGYPAAGWLFSLPYRALNTIAPLRIGPYYAAYLTINWLILVIAGLVLVRLAGTTRPEILLLPVVMLVLNGVTKAFFWSPHTQLFNILVPVLAIAAGTRFRNTGLTRTTAVTLGLASGILMLVYGAFVLVPVTAAVVSMIFAPRHNRSLASVLILALATVLPFLLWRQFVVLQTGGFYMHETSAYREFVWLTSTPGDLPQNILEFIRTIPVALGIPAALAVLARATSAGIRGENVEGLITFACVSGVFFALMGFYTPRLTFELAVPIIVVIALCLKNATRSIRTPVLLATIAYAVWTIGTDQSAFLAGTPPKPPVTSSN